MGIRLLMLKTRNRRSVERKTLVKRNGKWEEKPFKELEKGDNFQLFEPSGDQVFDHKNDYIFCATSQPYFCQELEAWVIDVEENIDKTNSESKIENKKEN
jgi:hypothetical protein